MTARIGTCTGCGAQYGNIPPTVTATKVRCRKCGGEVEIPALDAAPETAPAAPEEAAGGLTATPIGDAKPKGNGERPAAAAPVDRSVARPEPAKPVAEPAPKPPQRPPVVKPPPPKRPAARPVPPPPKAPARKPEAPKMAAEAPLAKEKDPAKAAALLAQLKARKGPGATQEATPHPGGKPADADKGADLLAKLKAKKAGEGQPSAAKKPAAAPPKPPARRQAASKRRSADDHDPRHAHHHHPHVKKGPPVLLTLISVVALGIIAVGMWWFLEGANKKAAPSPEAGLNAAAPAAGVETTAGAGGVIPPPAAAGSEAAAAPDADAGTSQPVDAQPVEPSGAAAEAAVPPPAQEPVGEDPEWSPPAAGEEIEWRGFRFGDSFKLELVPLLGKWTSTDDATWAEFVDDADLYLADEGASSTRAGARLEEGGRDAYPAIVNAMLKTDWSDHYSIGLCHSLNNIIVKIGQGTNLGWKSLEGLDQDTKEWDEAIFFNKRVVIYWYNFWVSKFSVNDEEWAGFATKHSEANKDAEAAKPAVKPPGGIDFDD